MLGTLTAFIAVQYTVFGLQSVLAFTLPTNQLIVNRIGKYTPFRGFHSVPNILADGIKSKTDAISSPKVIDPCQPQKLSINPSLTQKDAREKEFILVSDSTGLTVQTALSKCLSQFDWSDDECIITDEGEVSRIKRTIHTFIRSEEAVSRIVKEAGINSAMVAFTFADPDLRARAATLCEKEGVPFVDLMGPMLLRMTDFLKQSPAGKARTRVSLNADYFHRIDAVEFTLKADDGQAPWLLKDADVIIVGVSRTGKTPLSVILSQNFGWKVGNVPLVLEVKAPEELLDTVEIDSRRVFCLTINPKELRRIRETRLQMRGVKEQEDRMIARGGAEKTKSNYADRNYMLRDLKSAHDLCQAQNWTQIDVTGRAIEETSVLISKIISERFGDSDN